MAEEQKQYIDADFTGTEPANIEVSMIGGVPLKGGPYVLGNNQSSRHVKIHPDDLDMMLGTGLVKRASGSNEATEEQRKADADNSASIDFLQRTGVSQETAAKLSEAGYTTPESLKQASDEDLTAIGLTDKKELRTLRAAVGSK